MQAQEETFSNDDPMELVDFEIEFEVSESDNNANTPRILKS